jgi:hypothetical protein
MLVDEKPYDIQREEVYEKKTSNNYGRQRITS